MKLASIWRQSSAFRQQQQPRDATLNHNLKAGSLELFAHNLIVYSEIESSAFRSTCQYFSPSALSKVALAISVSISKYVYLAPEFGRRRRLHHVTSLIIQQVGNTRVSKVQYIFGSNYFGGVVVKLHPRLRAIMKDVCVVMTPGGLGARVVHHCNRDKPRYTTETLHNKNTQWLPAHNTIHINMLKS